jgi:hypothetical protein
VRATSSRSRTITITSTCTTAASSPSGIRCASGPKKDLIAGWAKAARAQGPAGREIAIAAMGAAQGYLKKPVAMVECVGTGQALAFRQEAAGLRVALPSAPPALPYAFALKVLT